MTQQVLIATLGSEPQVVTLALDLLREKGHPITVASDVQSKRLNVLGFLNRQNELVTYTFEGRIDSEVVMACIDDFCQDLHKKTVIVMDQASIHTSKEFTAKIPE